MLSHSIETNCNAIIGDIQLPSLEMFEQMMENPSMQLGGYPTDTTVCGGCQTSYTCDYTCPGCGPAQ